MDKKRSKSRSILVDTARSLIKYPAGGKAKWFDYQFDEKNATANDEINEEIAEKSEHLLQREVDLYNNEHRSSSSNWNRTILTGGTQSDKNALYILGIKTAPVHSLAYVQALLSGCAKRSSREATQFMAVLKDIFLLDLLPPNRKLVSFNAFLLPLLANKLGHPNYKVASKVCNLLSILTQNQPNMRSVILLEVGRIIYRPNISRKAQFYGVCFLSQIMLKSDENDLAVKLLSIYFGLFRILVQKGEIDNKMLSILLAGTNRAFPYAKGTAESGRGDMQLISIGNTDQLLSEIDTLYKVAAKSNFGTSLQTLKLLYQLLDASEGVSDRYYSALYRKLNDTSLYSQSHTGQLLHLLYKVIRSDNVAERVRAFLKRLLQCALNEQPTFACASLLLVSRIVEEKPAILALCGTANNLHGIKSGNEENSDEEEEKYDDVHGADSDFEENSAVLEENTGKKTINSSWIHRKNIAAHRRSFHYDVNARNPLFSSANCTLEYELVLLSQHFHPTVALFARNILNNERLEYNGDPLCDFSLMRFLDRFVFRNPKPKETQLMKAPRRKAYIPRGRLAVDSKEYADKNDDQIPVEEKFLHRYATEMAVLRGRRQFGTGHEEGHQEEVDSDEFDRVLENFEPGAKNDHFEIDFSSKIRRKSKRHFEEENKSDDDGSDFADDGQYLDSDEDLLNVRDDALLSADKVAHF